MPRIYASRLPESNKPPQSFARLNKLGKILQYQSLLNAMFHVWINMRKSWQNNSYGILPLDDNLDLIGPGSRIISKPYRRMKF